MGKTKWNTCKAWEGWHLNFPLWCPSFIYCLDLSSLFSVLRSLGAQVSGKRKDYYGELVGDTWKKAIKPEKKDHVVSSLGSIWFTGNMGLCLWFLQILSVFVLVLIPEKEFRTRVGRRRSERLLTEYWILRTWAREQRMFMRNWVCSEPFSSSSPFCLKLVLPKEPIFWERHFCGYSGQRWQINAYHRRCHLCPHS